MKIIIDKIDAGEPKAIGFSKMESYPVHFQCATFQGWARFVPVDGDSEFYLNREVEVEIAHESIDGLCASKNGQYHVIPLAQTFSYHVRGVVKTITYHSEPEGNRTTYIVAGDAAFALSLNDIGSLRPSEGETVEFEVHGLSLWDELI